MKPTITLSAALLAVAALSACDRPAVVTVPTPSPSPMAVPVPVPGPAGPSGTPGATGAPGRPGDTGVIVVTPPASAPK